MMEDGEYTAVRFEEFGGLDLVGGEISGKELGIHQ